MINMATLQLEGDTNDGGGIITDTYQNRVFFFGKPVALEGSTGTGHPPCPLVPDHCEGVWRTVASHSNVMFLGRKINVTGDVDTCGHARLSGQNKVSFF